MADGGLDGAHDLEEVAGAGGGVGVLARGGQLVGVGHGAAMAMRVGYGEEMGARRGRRNPREGRRLLQWLAALLVETRREWGREGIHSLSLSLCPEEVADPPSAAAHRRWGGRRGLCCGGSGHRRRVEAGQKL